MLNIVISSNYTRAHLSLSLSRHIRTTTINPYKP